MFFNFKFHNNGIKIKFLALLSLKNSNPGPLNVERKSVFSKLTNLSEAVRSMYSMTQNKLSHLFVEQLTADIGNLWPT